MYQRKFSFGNGILHSWKQKSMLKITLYPGSGRDFSIKTVLLLRLLALLDPIHNVIRISRMIQDMYPSEKDKVFKFWNLFNVVIWHSIRVKVFEKLNLICCNHSQWLLKKIRIRNVSPTPKNMFFSLLFCSEKEKGFAFWTQRRSNHFLNFQQIFQTPRNRHKNKTEKKSKRKPENTRRKSSRAEDFPSSFTENRKAWNRKFAGGWYLPKFFKVLFFSHRNILSGALTPRARLLWKIPTLFGSYTPSGQNVWFIRCSLHGVMPKVTIYSAQGNYMGVLITGGS